MIRKLHQPPEHFVWPPRSKIYKEGGKGSECRKLMSECGRGRKGRSERYNLHTQPWPVYCVVEYYSVQGRWVGRAGQVLSKTPTQDLQLLPTVLGICEQLEARADVYKYCRMGSAFHNTTVGTVRFQRTNTRGITQKRPLWTKGVH
ncbi:hypothetical protein J6590_077155 [Homalodisca vitripennis]|nr:hypothetical protein J6590_077155 [Homalodisca vitripennis]